ncbi:hypothetical protein PTSG_02062 [Salpingoeca rosetta]|uniref:Uncharacterized protein n=1 Tax=Salpingoeca rosetta (strain ATCC 50818 / BSB-021) TaxID=946362 RepID=F2TZS2_SALR5|nr:uncharacterized protein PTSG_02062 [Salpingoeca rosetta]EGD79096.1 hypothetical protein PTSG_02062 [Salpingoeca rosetta]|eukprot:XP_004998052.1 hypothetical protein PTSG_02062 [Salpingoeca rosetta]
MTEGTIAEDEVQCLQANLVNTHTMYTTQLARVSVTVDKCPPTHEFEMKPRRAIGKPAMATIKEGDTGDEEKQDELAFQMDADDDDDDGLSLLDRQLGAGMDSTPDAGNRSDDADHGDDEAPGAADADENNKGDKTDNGDQHTASAQANASDAGDGDNALAGSNKAQAETTPSASSPLSSNTTTTAHDAADAADADSNNDSHGRDGPPPKVAKRADSPNATQQQ